MRRQPHWRRPAIWGLAARRCSHGFVPRAPALLSSPSDPVTSRRVIRPMATALGAGFLALIVASVVVLAGPPLARQWTGRTQMATHQQGSLMLELDVNR